MKNSPLIKIFCPPGFGGIAGEGGMFDNAYWTLLCQNTHTGWKIHGSKPNVRHLICKDNYLYASINMAGYVQRTRMFNVYAAIEELEKGAKTAKIVEWDNCKVFPGARTIVSSPDGRFIFAACHGSSRIAVVETRTMTMLGSIGVDSYPVGLAISKDGDWLISTSQGRDGSGGNAVDVYKIEYK